MQVLKDQVFLYKTYKNKRSCLDRVELEERAHRFSREVENKALRLQKS